MEIVMSRDNGRWRRWTDISTEPKLRSDGEEVHSFLLKAVTTKRIKQRVGEPRALHFRRDLVDWRILLVENKNWKLVEYKTKLMNLVLHTLTGNASTSHHFPYRSLT